MALLFVATMLRESHQKASSLKSAALLKGKEPSIAAQVATARSSGDAINAECSCS